MSVPRRVVLSVVLLACAGTLTGLVAAPATHRLVQRIDSSWLSWMVDARWAPLVVLAMVLNVVGSTILMGLVWVVVITVLGARRRWRVLAGFVVAVALTEICTWTLKEALDRPRPPGALVATGDDSFPSAHTSAAAVTAVAIGLAVAPRRHRGRWLAGGLLFAAAMAWSRTYLAAHWLSDVLAALLFAAAFALGAQLVTRGLDRVAGRRPAQRS